MTAYRLISEPQADLDIEAVLNLGVSADLGLSRFHGADPLQIAAGPYDLQLRFDPPPLASPPPRGYSAREFRDSREPRGARIQRGDEGDVCDEPYDST